MNISILIVEDEAPIRQMLSFALRRSGITPIEASTIEEANELIKIKSIDLILLDCMMPDQSGINWLIEIKKKPLFQIPVIMLTARAEQSNKIRALNSGADDYITKPFSPKELLARINAVYRRSNKTEHSTDAMDGIKKSKLTANGVILDLENHRLMINDKAAKIGPLEYKLLHYLMRHPYKALSREKLLNKVWGDQADVLERTVDVHIRRVRRILEAENLNHLIESVRGVGYRFNADVKS